LPRWHCILNSCRQQLKAAEAFSRWYCDAISRSQSQARFSPTADFASDIFFAEAEQACQATIELVRFRQSQHTPRHIGFRQPAAAAGNSFLSAFSSLFRWLPFSSFSWDFFEAALAEFSSPADEFSLFSYDYFLRFRYFRHFADSQLFISFAADDTISFSYFADLAIEMRQASHDIDIESLHYWLLIRQRHYIATFTHSFISHIPNRIAIAPLTLYSHNSDWH